MDGIVGVRFVEAGAVTYCRPGDLDVGIGDYVVVHTDRGERLGWIVIAPDQVAVSDPQGPMRVIDRLASEADVEASREKRTRAREDLGRAQAIAARADPRVRVASIEYDLAGTHCELTFSAPERVEYRWFQQQCAELFATDVQVRQVGDRDRAKALGDVGVCGQALCCSTWMTEFPSISVRMAKDQDLPPNPSKISGVCGRLLCCLSFEVEQYRELRGDLPKVGKRVSTPAGKAKVLAIKTLEQRVRMRLDDTGEVIEIGVEELKAQYGTAVRPEELEAVVEEPVRRQDRSRRENLVAELMPVVERRRPAVVPRAEAPTSASASTAEPSDRSERTEASTDGQPKRRRRRGRRGGRRRRRSGEGGDASGGAQGSDEGSS